MSFDSLESLLRNGRWSFATLLSLKELNLNPCVFGEKTLTPEFSGIDHTPKDSALQELISLALFA